MLGQMTMFLFFSIVLMRDTHNQSARQACTVTRPQRNLSSLLYSSSEKPQSEDDEEDNEFILRLLTVWAPSELSAPEDEPPKLNEDRLSLYLLHDYVFVIVIVIPFASAQHLKEDYAKPPVHEGNACEQMDSESQATVLLLADVFLPLKPSKLLLHENTVKMAGRTPWPSLQNVFYHSVHICNKI